MIHCDETTPRAVRRIELETELAVVGGGVAGVCAAVTAARAGLHVVLVQDRPVLGGNASSEVRLWLLGATSHMGSNNRWAREGGFVDELMVENTWRNPEGNPYLLDALLLEKVTAEANITLLLNTAVDHVHMAAPGRIAAVEGYCSQNETRYHISAPLFCDASGDGIVGFLAGAPFRMGAESPEEFGERFAPSADYGELLGHSIYFYSRDTGKPVTFVPPAFALKDISVIPRWRQLNTVDYGCRFWWFEYGGRTDTIHATEEIKWELWKIVYGVWNYLKNSGNFPEAANLTLEWVGSIPGKRESRRFEGDYILRQQDIIEQRQHEDAVAYGGWSIDVHPADGVYSDKPGCTQWHSKGVYQIPYRCLYSKTVENLFLAGRLISCSHVAFASTRVMATCAHAAQAAGMAASICQRRGVMPRALASGTLLCELQIALQRTGQHIPGIVVPDPDDGAPHAVISATSELQLTGFADCGERRALKDSWALMLPVPCGPAPRVTFTVDAAAATTLHMQLRRSSKAGNHTPDVVLAERAVPLVQGADHDVTLDFDCAVEEPCYLFYCLLHNPDISVHVSDERVSGVLTLVHPPGGPGHHGAVQQPPPDIGVEAFEFWRPERRPRGKNLAVRIEPPVCVFGARNVVNGIARPLTQPNAWVAARDDARPTLTLRWPAPQTIQTIMLGFDTDFDHPMESVLMGHPERAMPFCVKAFRIVADGGRIVAQVDDNHQTRPVVRLAEPVVTRELAVEIVATHGAPAAVYEVRCYAGIV